MYISHSVLYEYERQKRIYIYKNKNEHAFMMDTAVVVGGCVCD
jgi:hypothetical protein